MSPLQAYDLAEKQKRRLARMFRSKIERLHGIFHRDPDAPTPYDHQLPDFLRRCRRDAVHAFAKATPGNWKSISETYQETVMRYGVKPIDPRSRQFSRDLREFHHSYAINFPLPEEQEPREVFRDLWKASPRQGGYHEVAYSVMCPLTGRYLMGVNFTIQPPSDSVHFIYGFINPFARGLGLSKPLIGLMREVARPVVAEHLRLNPSDRQPFHRDDGPLILFEKNIIDEMSLVEILLETAHVDVGRPPRNKSVQLTASSVSQSFRDLVWDLRGGRIVDYVYLQSSLEGVVRVPPQQRAGVIAHLTREARDANAQAILDKCLGGRKAGCTTLNLCTFVEPGRTSVPAAQVRLSNEIFQGISVVKDPPHLHDDIYFQAQMASLATHTRDGALALKRIAPTGLADTGFMQAEQTTRRLLGALTWPELQRAKDRGYAGWLKQKAALLPPASQ